MSLRHPRGLFTTLSAICLWMGFLSLLLFFYILIISSWIQLVVVCYAALILMDDTSPSFRVLYCSTLINKKLGLTLSGFFAKNICILSHGCMQMLPCKLNLRNSIKIGDRVIGFLLTFCQYIYSTRNQALRAWFQNSRCLFLEL